jgi:beta-glucanase (GH16 family)
MVLDNRPGKPLTPRTPSRSSRRGLTIRVSVALAVALIAGGGIVAKQHLAHSTTAPADTAPADTAPADTAPADTAPGTTVHGTTASGPSAAPQASQPKPFSPPPSWTVKFDSAFPGDQLDTNVWATCYPWWSGVNGCTNFGNPTDPELEWYESSQDRVSGGSLHLVAQLEPTPGVSKQDKPKQYACRSGMATTYPGFRFEYGYLQVTAKIPAGTGLWPALWLAAANQQSPPEIDILEHWASEPYGKVYLHPLSGARQGGAVNMPGILAGWHTFGIYWTKTKLVWTYDGQPVFATSTGVPQQAMYLIANLADDNTGPGSCSGSLDIKSVKVWQP